MATSLNLTKTDPIGSLTSIMDLFQGKTNVTTDSPTTTTTSTKSNLTQDQLNAIVGNAMAPVGTAQKTAGLYGSTGLALARGQIAAEVAGKYAGTTTTSSTSGGTRTSQVQAPLQGVNPVGAGLALQLGAPLLKKFGENGFDWLGDALNFGLDSSVGPAASAVLPDFFSSFSGTDAAGTASEAFDLASTGISDLFGATASSALGDVATDVAGDFLAGEAGGSIWDSITSFFGFADGGPVNTRGVDRLPPPITTKPTVNPILAASGARDPNPQTPRPTGSIYTPPTPTVANRTNAQLAAAIDGGSTGAGGGPDSGTLGGFLGTGGKGLASAVAFGGPLGFLGNIASTAFGAISAQNSLSPEAVAQPSAEENQQAVENAIAQDAMAEAASALGGLGDLGLGDATGLGDSGMGDASGLGMGEGFGGNVATGGHIKGPGTGTSDSIRANLSDGEYVIDAKTTAALGPEFFRAIQMHFNPSAVKGQLAQGRI